MVAIDRAIRPSTENLRFMNSDDPPEQRRADGVVTRRSPLPLAPTVRRLHDLMEKKGLKLFVLVDHSGEAASAGLSMNETKLLSSEVRPEARPS
jgi:hypothetical protein